MSLANKSGEGVERRKVVLAFGGTEKERERSVSSSDHHSKVRCYCGVGQVVRPVESGESLRLGLSEEKTERTDKRAERT